MTSRCISLRHLRHCCHSIGGSFDIAQRVTQSSCRSIVVTSNNILLVREATLSTVTTPFSSGLRLFLPRESSTSSKSAPTLVRDSPTIDQYIKSDCSSQIVKFTIQLCTRSQEGRNPNVELHLGDSLKCSFNYNINTPAILSPQQDCNGNGDSG